MAGVDLRYSDQRPMELPIDLQDQAILNEVGGRDVLYNIFT